jgi:hypothetical protein
MNPPAQRLFQTAIAAGALTLCGLIATAQAGTPSSDTTGGAAKNARLSAGDWNSLAEGVNLDPEEVDAAGRLTPAQLAMFGLVNDHIVRHVGEAHFNAYFQPCSVSCSDYYRDALYVPGGKNPLEKACQQWSVMYTYSYPAQVLGKDILHHDRLTFKLGLDVSRRYTQVRGAASCFDKGKPCAVQPVARIQANAERHLQRRIDKSAIGFELIEDTDLFLDDEQQRWAYIVSTGEKFKSSGCGGEVVLVMDAQSGKVLRRRQQRHWCE